MKKIALAVIVAALAASPAMAAKKKAKKAKEQTAAELNDNGYRFVRDSFPIYLPSWAMPVYMANQKQAKK